MRGPDRDDGSRRGGDGGGDKRARTPLCGGHRAGGCQPLSGFIIKIGSRPCLFALICPPGLGHRFGRPRVVRLARVSRRFGAIMAEKAPTLMELYS